MLSTRVLNLQKQYPDPMVALVAYYVLSGSWIASSKYSVVSRYPFSQNVDMLPPEHELPERDMRNIFMSLIRKRFDMQPFPPGLGGGPTIVTFATRVEDAAEQNYPGKAFRDYATEQIAEGMEMYANMFGPSKLEMLVPWLARIVSVAVKACRRISDENLRKLHTIFLAAPNEDRKVELVAQWLDAVLAARDASLALQALNRDIDLIADWAQATRPNIMSMGVYEAVQQSDRWHADEDRRRQEEQARLQIERKKKLKSAYSTPMFVYGPYSFYELKDEDALIDEGVCQHHCVASYWKKVQSGEVNIYSVRTSFEKRVATIEVNCMEATLDTAYQLVTQGGATGRGRGQALVEQAREEGRGSAQVCRENQVRGPANQEVTDSSARAAIGAFFAAQGIISRQFQPEINAARAQQPQGLSGILYGRKGVHKMLSGFGRRR